MSDVAKSPFKCSHPRQEIRKKLDAMNRPLLLRQCQDCGGNNSTYISHSAVPSVAAVPPWDEQLYKAGIAAADADRDSDQGSIFREREAEREAHQQRYEEYIRESPVWREKRLKVLARDKYLCQACLVNRATQVHHLTYDRLFNEPLFDLISVCDACHDAIHADKREGAA